ncbi:TnpV protein [Clostridium sp.]|uniref:TnpV protein n=1 Tax=Clostridium sp. TaxID=1506 RepID=UPI00307B5FF9
MGGIYRQEGDYLLPNLAVPEFAPIGIWGQRHLRYIRAHRKAIYTSLLLGGKLNNYLTEVDRQAEELFLRLVNQMAAQESISEQLKVENQMEWVRRMNSVRARTEEIIYVALIYR